MNFNMEFLQSVLLRLTVKWGRLQELRQRLPGQPLDSPLHGAGGGSSISWQSQKDRDTERTGVPELTPFP